MRIAFGTGDSQWTNHSPSALTASLEKEISRFGRVLKWINFFEPFFIFTPINWVSSFQAVESASLVIQRHVSKI